jgi:hypothetical protein
MQILRSAVQHLCAQTNCKAARFYAATASAKKMGVCIAGNLGQFFYYRYGPYCTRRVNNFNHITMLKYLKWTGMYGTFGALLLCAAKLIGYIPANIGYFWCTAPLWMPTAALIQVLGFVALLALVVNPKKEDDV